MKFNPDIHHRRSIRLRDYDYSGSGAYFVTICTHERECLFGEIVDGVIRLTEAGLAVQEEWILTAALREYVVLDEFIVMPNHFHAVLAIDDRRGTACRALDGYYERVIRNERELVGIRQYIADNPAKWAEDENYPAWQTSTS